MPGHKHNSSAGTQNQGNTLGDRSCVRQSKLYRMYESGNNVKSILGTSNLCWNTDQKEGAYKGQQIYDHSKAGLSEYDTHSDPRYEAQDMKAKINSSFQRSALSHLSSSSKVIPRGNNDYDDDVERNSYPKKNTNAGGNFKKDSTSASRFRKEVERHRDEEENGMSYPLNKMKSEKMTGNSNNNNRDNSYSYGSGATKSGNRKYDTEDSRDHRDYSVGARPNDYYENSNNSNGNVNYAAKMREKSTQLW